VSKKRDFKWATRNKWGKIMIFVCKPSVVENNKGEWDRTAYGYGLREGDYVEHLPPFVEKAIRAVLTGMSWKDALCEIHPDNWLPK